MKMPKAPKIALEPLPFFKRGTLVFAESGHELRLSDRHYRCDLKIKKKCNRKEGQINTGKLERNFVTLLGKFEIDADKSEKILDRLMRDNLVDVLLGPEKEIAAAENSMDATLVAAAQELVQKGKTKKADIKAFKDSYLKEKQSEYSILLAGAAFDTLRSIASEVPEETDRAKTFARIVKHLYLSNEGKILRIEFEPWGWYLLRLFDRSMPGYLDKVRKRIKIANQGNELSGVKLSEAARYFALVKPNEALGQDVSAANDWIRMMRDLFRSLMAHDLKGAQAMELLMLKMMQDLPVAAILGALAPAFEQKPRFKKSD